MNLTYLEQRATIQYTFDHIQFKRFSGWVRLEGNKVVVRRIRGRNQWHLCNVEDLVAVSEGA